MINPTFFIGAPLDFHKKCLIYPPTVKDVVSNTAFSYWLKILTYSQEDIEEELIKKIPDGQKVPTPFEFLLANCYNNKDFEKLTKQAFQLFLKQDVDFLYDQKIIVLGNLNQLLKDMKPISEWTYLEETDYPEFQNYIRESCGLKPLDLPKPEDENLDPRIKRMKAKARLRDRVKAKQNAKNGLNLETCLISICCMGIGITPLNIGEMSYASINAILRCYQEKEKYDIDIRSLLAGADSKKIHPKYWIRNLDE